MRRPSTKLQRPMTSMDSAVRPALLVVSVLFCAYLGSGRPLYGIRDPAVDLPIQHRELLDVPKVPGFVQEHVSFDFEVAITSSEPHLVTHNPAPSFLLDFGQKVQQFDPLQLFNISGTNRTNVAYELNNGRVYIEAFVPDSSQVAVLSLTVDAAVTKTPEGAVSGPASARLIYKPRNLGIDYLALGTGTAMVSVATGSLSAAVMAGLLAPLTPAGVMGHGLLGMLHWAQKLYLFSRLAVAAMPENFVQFGGTFSWSVANIPSGADSLVKQPPGVQSVEVAFQPELIQMTQQGRFVEAQTLPLNNSEVVSALLTGAQNPEFVSPLIIAPYLVPPSPPPPQQQMSPPWEAPPPPPPPPPPPSLPPPPMLPPPPPPLPPPPVIWPPPPVIFSPPPPLQPPPLLPPPPPPEFDYSPPPSALVLFRPPPPDSDAGGLGSLQVIPTNVERSAYGIPATLWPPPPPAPPQPIPSYAPVNLQGTPGSALANLLTSLGVPREDALPTAGRRRQRRLDETAGSTVEDPGALPSRRRLTAGGVADSIQFVVTSTGFDALESNGTSNEWALYGVPALAAVRRMQVVCGNSNASLVLHAARLLFYAGLCSCLLICGRWIQFTTLKQCRSRLLPNFLALRRLELFLMLAVLPAAATASSGLFAGSLGAVIVGVAVFLGVVVTSLAFLFMSLSVWLTSTDHRCVALVVQPAKPVRKGQLERFLDFWCGPANPDCQWLDLDTPRSNLLAKVGPLFEDNCGALHELQNATYELPKGGGKLQRGEVVPIKHVSFRNAVRSCTLQSFATLIGTSKVAAIGLLIVGLSSLSATEQLVLLLALSAVHLLYLRLFVPFRCSVDQAVEIISAATDIITVACGFLLLHESAEHHRYAIGWAMLSAQLLSGAAYLLGLLARIFRVLSTAAWPEGFMGAEASGSQRFANAAFELLYHIKRDPERLEAKYGLRWLLLMRKRQSKQQPVKAQLNVEQFQHLPGYPAPKPPLFNKRPGNIGQPKQRAQMMLKSGMRRSSSIGAAGLPPRSPVVRNQAVEVNNPLMGLECIKRGRKLRQAFSLPNPSRLATLHELSESEADLESGVAALLPSSGGQAAEELILPGTRSESLRRWQALADELDDMCRHSVANLLDTSPASEPTFGSWSSERLTTVPQPKPTRAGGLGHVV